MNETATQTASPERSVRHLSPGSDHAQSLGSVIAALSHALDLTEGQSVDHSLRVCWIGLHIGQEVGIHGQELWNLYFTLLLKDLGSSANAAQISEIYLTDDRIFKHQQKRLGQNFGDHLGFLLFQTGIGADIAKRFRALSNLFNNSKIINRKLINSRSTGGSTIARELDFPEEVAQAVHCLDEHWDGSGLPEGLAGDDIPLHARIALLAQVIDVFYTNGDRDAAKQEALNRSGTWFDPRLVSAFIRVAKSVDFWTKLGAADLQQHVLDQEPENTTITINEEYYDRLAFAFGKISDAKSPYTHNHSKRVAHYAELMGGYLGLDANDRRILHRAALLHDLGKLGISNKILDKPGPLTEEEWEEMRRHTTHTGMLLSHLSILGGLQNKIAAHKEKLDGTGYPLGLNEQQISLETRIITIADFFDALTTERSFRAAMPVAEALDIIESEIGKSIDARCFAALQAVIGPLETFHERFGNGSKPVSKNFPQKISARA